jgi:hypothetical protein
MDYRPPNIGKLEIVEAGAGIKMSVVVNLKVFIGL